MARFNKIYAGPFTEAMPQVQEAPAAASTLPGLLVVINGSGKFAIAGADAVGRLHVVQENYLAMEGVDVAITTDNVVIGMEMLDEQLFRVRVPTGNNLIKGDPLELVAGGKLAKAAGEGRVVAYAHETYNNNTGADQLVTIRVAKGYIVAPPPSP